jgi:phosphoglycolate phosphatase
MVTSSTSKPDHPPVQGLIFDLDGTLIVSVVDFPKMKRRMIEYIETLGVPDTNYSINQTTNEIINDLDGRLNDLGRSATERDRVFVEMSKILTEVEFENLDKVELLPGVIEFINHCTENKLKMGVLTRASGEYMRAALEKTGILEQFKVILSRDDFGLLKSKPHPYALEFMVNKLAIPPENLVFIGDHKLDYMCAQTGKMRFIGVLSGSYTRSGFKELGCEWLVEDFHELSKLLDGFNQV